MTADDKAFREKADNNEPVVSLGEAFPLEQQRVRELIPLYQAIGPAGSFGLWAINQALARAERAAASGDVVAMLRSYEELKGFKE